MIGYSLSVVLDSHRVDEKQWRSCLDMLQAYSQVAKLYFLEFRVDLPRMPYSCLHEDREFKYTGQLILVQINNWLMLNPASSTYNTRGHFSGHDRRELLEAQPRTTLTFWVLLKLPKCTINGWCTTKSINQLFYNIANVRDEAKSTLLRPWAYIIEFDACLSGSYAMNVLELGHEVSFPTK